jgi:hypothetical protein
MMETLSSHHLGGFMSKANTHSNIGSISLGNDDKFRVTALDDTNLRASLGTLGSWSTTSSPINRVKEWIEPPKQATEALGKTETTTSKYPNYLKRTDVLMDTLLPRPTSKRFMTPVTRFKKHQKERKSQTVPAKSFDLQGKLM